MATHSTGSDPSDETPRTKEEIKQIIERIRQEFEDSFTTIPDPEVRKQRLEQSLTNNKIQNTCQDACLAAYANCRNAGGTEATCQAALNTCINNCD